MKVSEAVLARKSVRAFLDTPVSDAVIREVLEKASRAPSGGNLQPWRIFVVNGEAHRRFVSLVAERLAANPMGEPMDYAIYPENLKEPYRTSRYAVGEAMYALMGVPKEDKLSRLQWLANNYRFFGAPAALFCFVDRIMGPPQWSDLGMFLQTAMLLFQERGIDTCPQEAWARWPKTVAEFCGAPDEWMLFCGLAIGHKDPNHPVNRLETQREPVDAFATWVR